MSVPGGLEALLAEPENKRGCAHGAAEQVSCAGFGGAGAGSRGCVPLLRPEEIGLG